MDSSGYTFIKQYGVHVYRRSQWIVKIQSIYLFSGTVTVNGCEWIVYNSIWVFNDTVALVKQIASLN